MDRNIRPDRLKLLRLHELMTLAPAPWLVKGVLREESMAQLYGHRGSYKSFVALSLAGSVASGVPWMGRPIPNAGLVIYVAAEGGGGMVQRVRAWVEQQGVPSYKVNMRFVTEPFTCLPEDDDMELLVERIKDAIDWVPEGYVDPDNGIRYEQPEAREWPRLIVVDTLARCFFGDENQQEDMGAFVKGLDRLKAEFNCAVLVIHHSGVAGNRPRGSTAFEGACDTVWRLEAEEKPEAGITLLCEKMKDSGDPEPIALIHREVSVKRYPTDEPDEDLTSVVIEDATSLAARRNKDAMAILRDTGPLSWNDWFSSSGLKKTTFHGMVTELRKGGEIIKENGVWRAL